MPPSKSHAHRLLIADFLAGGASAVRSLPEDSDDIVATKRCLCALSAETVEPVLDCGESGSTLRFLAPVAAALGKRPQYIRRGRLAERPFRAYDSLAAGLHELPGDVSSQFVTGLLFALPLVEGRSEIRFTSPLESCGYVEMTLKVLTGAGISVERLANGYAVTGPQQYRYQSMNVEGDWSGAAFWLAMNALGSEIEVTGLDEDSAQPDRTVVEMLRRLRQERCDVLELDVSQCPDLFPALSVAAAGTARRTRFVGIRRLRLKECDRVEAMRETLVGFGIGVEVSAGAFVVSGTDSQFRGGEFRSFGDHRIAMSIAVGATRASSSVVIDDETCAAKSYPSFFADFADFKMLC